MHCSIFSGLPQIHGFSKNSNWIEFVDKEKQYLLFWNGFFKISCLVGLGCLGFFFFFAGSVGVC